MKIHQVGFLVTYCALIGAPIAAAQEPGTITGIVVSENSTPVAGAIVSIEPTKNSAPASVVRQAETDSAGHFKMDNLALGSYKAFAKKESSRYPDTAFAFYSRNIVQTVVLTAGTPTASIIIRVGPPAGAIFGRILDRRSDVPLEATFILRWREIPSYFISLAENGSYSILVPPNTDFTLEVSAPLHQTQTYGAISGSSQPPLRIESGKDLELNVSLEPTGHPER